MMFFTVISLLFSAILFAAPAEEFTQFENQIKAQLLNADVELGANQREPRVGIRSVRWYTLDFLQILMQDCHQKSD